MFNITQYNKQYNNDFCCKKRVHNLFTEYENDYIKYNNKYKIFKRRFEL